MKLAVLVVWWLYADRVLKNFQGEKKYQKEKKISETRWESRERKLGNKKLEEYENESYHLLWWTDKWHFRYNCLALSEENNSVSRTDNFVNVFNSVTSPRVLYNRCVLHYFLTMSVGFHLNLTFGLNPQVGGIKNKRPIFQVEWLTATFILLHFFVCSYHEC